MDGPRVTRRHRPARRALTAALVGIGLLALSLSAAPSARAASPALTTMASDPPTRYGSARTSATLSDDASKPVTLNNPSPALRSRSPVLAAGGGTGALPWTVSSSNQLCTAVSLTPSLPSPQAVGTALSFTSVAGGCPNPVYQFWLLPPGGAWGIIQAYSSDGVLSAASLGTLGAGVNQIAVWAKQSGSTADLEWSNQASFTLTTSTPACASVSLSANPASPQAVGASVTFSALAGGCDLPTYQFWLQGPRLAWTVEQPYGAAASFTLDSSSLTAGGTYQVAVWVREQGSVATLEWQNTLSYTFTNPNAPCGSAGYSVLPGPPRPPGALVTFTGQTTSCATPTYQFWLLPPGGVWTIVQPYSATGTFIWDTSGLAAGAYQVALWVRQQGSQATLDWSYQGTYTLTDSSTGTLCAAVSESVFSQSAMQIDLRAVATGCTAPLYQFWLQGPGLAWTVVQAYSTSADWLWPTSGYPAGTYQIAVWAKQQGASGAFQASTQLSHLLGGGACSAVSESASPASPRPAGTTVTVTALATGCGTPTYQFWLLAPGGGWTIVQPYSTSGAFSWSTSGLAAGTYQIAVWARQQGSGASLEWSNQISFTLQ